MIHVVSTLTNNFQFVKYGHAAAGNLPPVLARVRIMGGANRPNMKGFGNMTTNVEGVPLWTPSGVTTQVSDENYEWLKQDERFQQFVKAGLIKVLTSAPGNDHNKIAKIVASDMSPRDTMSPLQRGDARANVKRIHVGSINEE